MTAEHAHGIDAGGEVEAVDEGGHGVRCDGCLMLAMVERAERAEAALARLAIDPRVIEGTVTPPANQNTASAADAVLAEARRLCCGENPAAHHAATDKHSELMAFAGRLAGAVRGSSHG